MILDKRNTVLVAAVAGILFAVAFSWWLFASPPFPMEKRIPGLDNRPEVKPISDTAVIGEYFDTLNAIDEIVPGSWPRFRGADYDNIDKDPTPLAESWDTSGPPVLWQTTLGEGYAGPSVLNGRVYIMDYDERRKADMLRCFSLKSGVELWRRWYNVEIKRNHGYSRTIPTVTDKYVITIGPKSHVMCLDPVSGDMKWSLDLELEYGIPGYDRGRITPDFYAGQCPLVDDDVAVLAPGVKALMIGVDCETGEVLWETPNPDSLRMSHTSIIPMVIHGKRMYVYNALGGVCGVSAEGDDIGKLLWVNKEWNPSIVQVPSPVYLGNNEIAVFGSYGSGGARLKIYKEGNVYSTELTDVHKPAEGLANEQHTPIIKDGFIWVVKDKSAGLLKNQLVCYSRSDILNPVWSSGTQLRFGTGMGPYIMSGDKLYVLDDGGKLSLFRINGSEAELLAQHQVIKAIEAWGPMAIAGRHLLFRDAHNLLCLDIGLKN